MKRFLQFLFCICMMMLLHASVFSCSMYKITVDGRTMVGNNEDSWRETSGIWFEKGKQGKYSVAYVGYADKPDPDGAVNEYGLVFDAFTMYAQPLAAGNPDKQDFSYSHLRTIMQRCKNVDEVYAFLKEMNLRILGGSPLFNGGMLLFVDRLGKYLVVEAGHLTLGNDPSFVLANFSYANTKDLSTVKIERYRKGVQFLKDHQPEADIAFCAALSDTMCMNRSKIGDGTLYTTIYDLDSGLVHVYFFHDYSKQVTFDLKQELLKEDHHYMFAGLFPGNTGYQKLLDYQTPHNNLLLAVFIIGCGVMFFLSFLFFAYRALRSFSTKTRFVYFRSIMAAWSLALCYDMYVLMRNQSVFYFPAPYKDEQSILITLSSYLPFVLLMIIIPLLFFCIQMIRQKMGTAFERWLLLINNVAYVLLLCLFVYWKMF